MDIHACLFDLDGTLLDTLEDLNNTLNTVLQRHALPQHTLAECRGFVGSGAETMVRRALPEDLRDAQSVAAFSREVDEVYHDSWHICTRLYDGIPEMLDRLAAAGYPMAVLSNKPEHFTQRMVAHFLGQWPFAVVRGARDGCPLKPNPAASLHIAEILRTAPAHMAHVGDSDIDMHTATAAGMLPAGVTWGFRTKGELQRAGAAMLIDEPSHIPAVFNDAT